MARQRQLPKHVTDALPPATANSPRQSAPTVGAGVGGLIAAFSFPVPPTLRDQEHALIWFQTTHAPTTVQMYAWARTPLGWYGLASTNAFGQLNPTPVPATDPGGFGPANGPGSFQVEVGMEEVVVAFYDIAGGLSAGEVSAILVFPTNLTGADSADE